MAHAATKTSCGHGGKKGKVANPELTELITNMTSVITNVKLYNERYATVLDKWPAIVAWYKIRAEKAIRDSQPPPDFLLEDRQIDFIQVLSILAPIVELKFKCQAERPEQVEVLMQLYMIRIDQLCLGQAIPHYLSMDEQPQWLLASSLSKRSRSFT
ncbi:hypothetical protein PHMEG_00017112 [Phytophthora megakarya]|uniref:Uncharacterized protein n=1 Tax=Phytophthora megakarya TaxID=4795 RepID=A0A225VZQ4_9STRA|nr:hypothetical protein PHMEG_00017112 [Phytophthora megakarya]